MSTAQKLLRSRTESHNEAPNPNQDNSPNNNNNEGFTPRGRYNNCSANELNSTPLS
jgi:hypothetical protein